MKSKKSILKKILIVLVALLLIIQVFRIDKTNPLVVAEKDFVVMTNTPEEIRSILKTSCYDCHSNESTYPWYTNIAPFSWWTKNHINEGREELNFSDWGSYSSRRKDHKLKECIEEVEENEMPLNYYLWVHGEARLSPEQKKQLMDWFESLRTHESDEPEKK